MAPCRGRLGQMTEAMRVCINHPDRPGKWRCQKFDLAYCDDCCRCAGCGPLRPQ